MKKFLLTMASVCSLAMAVNAAEIQDVDQNWKDLTEFPYYVMDYKPEIKDGNIVVANEEAKANYLVQYFVCPDFPLVADVEYTVTAKIKSDVAGAIDVVMGTWGKTKNSQMTVKGDNEWNECTAVFDGVPMNDSEKSFLIFQSGAMVGTYEIEWVKVSHKGEAIVIPTPEEGNILASYFTGNGEAFGGWGATSIEAVEEDGKPCLKVVNEEAKDSWAAQIAINYDFEPGTKYYINFDVKGTPFTGIPSGFQGERDYAGCGDMNNFNVTEEWQNVTISGTAKNAGTEDNPNLPVRWLASVGKYVGTMFITNLNLYTEKTSAVEVVPVVDNSRTVVYNLQGIKVLDTEDNSELNTLPRGIYIVNGKKIAVSGN